MDKAKILRLCNQIEMIIVTVCNTGYTLQPGDEGAIFNRTRAIMDEVRAPPKTNADRIRQMTDEELAAFIDIFSIEDICRTRCAVVNYQDCRAGAQCKLNIFAWLKQEVSEDATERTD